MLEQVSNAIAFYAMFVETRVGKTGLTVTVDIWRINTSGTATEVVTGGSATEVGDGLYRYTLASGSVTVEGEYVAVFKTSTTTVDQQHIPALWVVQKAGVENLDAAVTSRQTSIWAAASSTVNLSGTTVKDLSATGLDLIAITAPSGVATTFREMVVQVWSRFFKKATKTSTTLTTYADNGTTVVTTQTVSDTGGTQTQGAAS